MKVNAITRTITIDNATVFRLFVNAVYGDAKAATGKDKTLYTAFGSLVGISDVDAVKIANDRAKQEDFITVTQFRKWLPTVFSEFARAILKASDETR